MASFFNDIALQPPNAVLGLALQCNQDKASEKIDLVIGAYRGDDGKLLVLDCVREAEEFVYKANAGHEYLNQDGLEGFSDVCQSLLLGDNNVIVREGKVHTIQTLSGTGALRLAFDFLHCFMSKNKVTNADTVVYYPSTTWANHPEILKVTHFPTATYRYLDSTGCSLDFDGLCEDLSHAAPNSVFLFHMCGHNPTGVDPTEGQWKQIYTICRERNCLPVFDNAYQGFVSGNPDQDAFPVRYFTEQAHLETSNGSSRPFNMLVCCSFAKNFGLYGERVGALHVITTNAAEVPVAAAQLRAISRAMYSTCPGYGARLVLHVLSDPARKEQWKKECHGMATRIDSIRRVFYDKLLSSNVKGSWDHVLSQRGMFSYTGIDATAVATLQSKYHIYMLKTGRISMAGLNTHNVDRFVAALVDVLGTN